MFKEVVGQHMESVHTEHRLSSRTFWTQIVLSVLFGGLEGLEGVLVAQVPYAGKTERRASGHVPYACVREGETRP